MRYRIQGFQASMCKVGTGLCCVAYLIIVGENTMKAVTWIGVDIAKKSFVAAQRTFEGFQTEPFALDPKGLKAFANWLPDEPQLQIVLEATGPYWRAFPSNGTRSAINTRKPLLIPTPPSSYCAPSSNTKSTWTRP